MKSVNLGYNWNDGGDEEIKSNPGYGMVVDIMYKVIYCTAKI